MYSIAVYKLYGICVLKCLLFVTSVLKRMNHWNHEEQDLWKDFKARSRCIEVLYQPDKDSDDKILTRVYFDFNPLVSIALVSVATNRLFNQSLHSQEEIREEEKETITNAITKESQEENLTEFNELGRSIRRNAKHMYKVRDRGVCV